MPAFRVETAQQTYDAIVERGILARATQYVPRKAGAVFVVTTRDVWELHGQQLSDAVGPRLQKVLFFPGGEELKRIAEVERLAEQMMEHGGDRSSLVIAF